MGLTRVTVAVTDTLSDREIEDKLHTAFGECEVSIRRAAREPSSQAVNGMDVFLQRTRDVLAHAAEVDRPVSMACFRLVPESPVDVAAYCAALHVSVQRNSRGDDFSCDGGTGVVYAVLPHTDLVGAMVFCSRVIAAAMQEGLSINGVTQRVPVSSGLMVCDLARHGGAAEMLEAVAAESQGAVGKISVVED